MPLESHDYFKWFNDEITRYRNHEWQIAGYSGAILAFIAAWMCDPSKKHLILAFGPVPPTADVSLLLIACICAELHTHGRLNFYRTARHELMKNNAPITAILKVDHPFVSGWRDFFYVSGFLIFISSMGAMAIYAIWKFR